MCVHLHVVCNEDVKAGMLTTSGSLDLVRSRQYDNSLSSRGYDCDSMIKHDPKLHKFKVAKDVSPFGCICDIITR